MVVGSIKPVQVCTCCGSDQITQSSVLWDSLINEWQLSNDEVKYINRQQGMHCIKCHANLRSMALAKALKQREKHRDALCNLAR